MKVTNQDIWDNYVKQNTDFYGKGVIDFAQRWAELIEAEISNGVDLATIAKESSHKADTDGITGFMYGAAVQMLSQVWEHGEELRQWHNAEYGVEASQEGVVNPALLTISKKQ